MCDSITGNDERETYCRKLGHKLRFAYCRTTDGDTVCPKILDCWFEHDTRARISEVAGRLKA